MKDMDTYIDISNKKCDKDRVIIGRKLSDLINSREGLWRKIAELARTIDYCLIESFDERILAELEVIEKEIGKSEKIKEIRGLVAALARGKP
jgi:molybdopterin-guanine dinucleotide biosynthesis protein